jgi:hypothetical protein
MDVISVNRVGKKVRTHPRGAVPFPESGRASEYIHLAVRCGTPSRRDPTQPCGRRLDMTELGIHNCTCGCGEVWAAVTFQRAKTGGEGSGRWGKWNGMRPSGHVEAGPVFDPQWGDVLPTARWKCPGCGSEHRASPFGFAARWIAAANAGARAVFVG